MPERAGSCDPSPAAKRIARECLAVRLRMLHRAVAGLYDRALRPHGIGIAQMNLLVAIEVLGPVPAARLATRLHVEKSTLSRNLDRMRREGWIDAVAGDDARSQALRVTAKGRRILERATPAWEEAQNRAKRFLGAEATRTLLRSGDALLRARRRS